MRYKIRCAKSRSIYHFGSSIIKKFVYLALVLLALVLVFLTLSDTTRVALFGEVYSEVSTNKKLVALTFDDGPMPEYTDAILTILRDHGVKATFFLVGDAIEKHPAEARSIVAAQHEIGNHSYHHKPMVFMGCETLAREIEATDTLIKNAGYGKTPTFRPPYGLKFWSLSRYLAQQNRQTILATIAPDSTLANKASAAKMVDYVKQKIQPGSIILLHVMFASREESLKSVAGIIQTLQAQDYRFVTVSELLKAQSGASVD